VGRKSRPEKASYYETGIVGPSTVGCFPGGASPFGCEEMSGNVWEWTRSLYADYPYPAPGKKRDRLEASSASGPRVLRGGACSDVATSVRCAVRHGYDPSYRFRFIGFRVVLLPFSSDL